MGHLCGLCFCKVVKEEEEKKLVKILTIIAEVINQDDFSDKMLRTSVQNTEKKTRRKELEETA